MEQTSDNNYTGTGPDLVKIVDIFPMLKGAIVTYGLGGSGKTVFSEVVTSSVHSAVLESGKFHVAANSSVMSAALKSWINPAFFQAFVDHGLKNESFINNWAQDFITNIGLGSLNELNALASIHKPEVSRSVAQRLKLAGEAGDRAVSAVAPNTANLLPVYSYVPDQADWGTTYFTPVLSPAGNVTDLYAGFSDEGPNRRPVMLVSTLPVGAERADPSDWENAISPYLEVATIVANPNEPEWFCASMKSNSVSVDQSVYSHLTFTSNEGAELCITQHGPQIRTPAQAEDFSTHTVIDFTESLAESLAKRLAPVGEEIVGSESEDGSDSANTFDSLLEDNAVMLLSMLSNSDAISMALDHSVHNAASGHAEIQRLIASLDLVKAPSLILTEMKATSAYGAVASNRSIEERGVLLSLKMNDGTVIEYNADCSLVTAAVGSLALWPVTHISVLDLTMAYEIVFNSPSQKGGLDPSMLHMMQYFSNIATMARGHFIIETRDDFTVSVDQEAADKRARTTLGANSRVSIQVQGTGAEARAMHIRIKGGEDMEDCSINLLAVAREDYPANILRDNSKLKTISDFM